MEKIMSTKIVKWHNKEKIVYETEKETTREAVIEAVSSRANLGGADLRGADLSGADLRDANLRGADLSGADLRDANLSDANLGGADLRDANLRDANLGGADLRGADLSGAELMDVKFYGRGGSTHIKKTQIDELHVALGIIVEE